MDEDQKMTVRTVFGKEIEVEKLVGVAAAEVYGINPSLLHVENGDPNYVYAWFVADDPETSLYLRRGEYELVDPKTDPCVAAGADKTDKVYRIRELVLARTPKEKYVARKDSARMRAIHRELASDEQFRAAVQGISGRISPGETGSPRFSKKEEVKVGNKFAERVDK